MGAKIIKYNTGDFVVSNNIQESISNVDSRFLDIVDDIKQLDDDVHELTFRMNLLKRNRKKAYYHNLHHSKNWR